MKLITWNIQWCRGVDLKVDPARVIADARRLADFDVLCVQEVADNFPDPRLGGSVGEDQFAVLAALLPGYTAVPGIAVDHPAEDGRRRRFGNMILSRLPVRQAFRHLLPYPADHDVPGMPRIAVEAVVAAPFGDVRIITTHLEYYSQKKRAAQVEALRAIYAEGYGYAGAPLVSGPDEGPVRVVRATGRHDHHRRFQPRAGRSAARADGGAVRRRRAAAGRRVGARPSGSSASADDERLPEGESRRFRWRIATSSSSVRT